MGRQRQGTSHQCQWCSIQFDVEGTREPKFCSRTCFYNAQTSGQLKTRERVRPQTFCEQCGIEFVRADTKAKFCSTECYHQSHTTGRNPLASKNSSFIPSGWQTRIQPAIIARDQVCQWCQTDEDLCVHHKVDRYHNEPENLITLCRKCHTKVTQVEQGWLLLQEYGYEHFQQFLSILT